MHTISYLILGVGAACRRLAFSLLLSTCMLEDAPRLLDIKPLQCQAPILCRSKWPSKGMPDSQLIFSNVLCRRSQIGMDIDGQSSSQDSSKSAAICQILPCLGYMANPNALQNASCLVSQRQPLHDSHTSPHLQFGFSDVVPLTSRVNTDVAPLHPESTPMSYPLHPESTPMSYPLYPQSPQRHTPEIQSNLDVVPLTSTESTRCRGPYIHKVNFPDAVPPATQFMLG